jgi:hypothetical protein
MLSDGPVVKAVNSLQTNTTTSMINSSCAWFFKTVLPLIWHYLLGGLWFQGRKRGGTGRFTLNKMYG